MICAVIPTRYHPPELDRLLAVLARDGVCTHLIVDPDDGDHLIYRMWNTGCDAAREHGAEYIAVLNDDIEILPGTLAILAKAFDYHESRRRPWEGPLGIAYPDHTAMWGTLPHTPIPQSTTGTWPGGMTGFAFLFRASLQIRFDESYTWWYGDSQFEKDVRAAGLVVARVLGLPLRHRLNHSGSRDWDRLAPIVARDRELFDSREAAS